MRGAKWVASLLVGAVFVGACGGSGSDKPDADAASASSDTPAQTRVFCEVVTRWAQAESDLEDVDYGANYETVDLLDRLIKLFDEAAQNAPPSLESALDAVREIPPDAVRISEGQKRDDAVEKLDAYVERHCDVLFSFEDVEYSE